MENERFEAEMMLARIFDNPVMFREFINDPKYKTPETKDWGDDNWHGLERHERAWTACRANRMSMCCGRSVHKTTTMIEMLYYWVATGDFIRGDQPNLFVMVPNKAQKDLSFGRIASACRKHWLISKLVDRNRINVSDGRIDFLNGFQFILRIAGSAGSEDNVIGVHTTKIWVDEAQEFPWKTWLSLQNCLKFEIPGYKMITSGVPNGERKENVLYTCDVLDEDYVTFNVSQEMMSWWSPEIELMRRKEYRALQEDSEDYKHFVLGQHGVPTFSVFDRIRFKKEEYEVRLEVITQEMLNKVRRTDPTTGQVKFDIENVVPTPPIPQSYGVIPKVGVGYDVGYSPDPAVFFIMYEDTKNGTWKNLMRISLQRVEYTLQREILMFLDRVYNFSFLGIDMGGPGKVQYQDLTGDFIDERVKVHNFKERIFPVEFGGQMAVAVQDENGELVEKKDQVKRVAVETVSRWTQESHRFVFSTKDDNLMDELERTKFSRNPVGEPVYKTVDDHQMAAMMCAILAYENRFGTPLSAPRLDLKPKLLPARWLDPYGVL
jgi:hypothetical protein